MNLLRCLCAALTLALVLPLARTTAGGKKNARQPVTLTKKASDDWLIKRLETGAKVLSDRDYLFTTLPAEVAGSYYIMRTSGDWSSWLAPQAVKADANVTVYLLLNTELMKKELVNEIAFNKLAKEGWKTVKGDVDGTFNAGEGWVWKAMKKDYKKGDLIIFLRTVELRVPVVFAFKEIAVKKPRDD